MTALVIHCGTYEWHCSRENLVTNCSFLELSLSGWSGTSGVISPREDDPDSVHTLVTFLYHGKDKIRRIIDNSSISGALVSATMRYMVADKYGVQGWQDASWDLMELALTRIRTGAEIFRYTGPNRVRGSGTYIVRRFPLANSYPNGYIQSRFGIGNCGPARLCIQWCRYNPRHPSA